MWTVVLGGVAAWFFVMGVINGTRGNRGTCLWCMAVFLTALYFATKP